MRFLFVHDHFFKVKDRKFFSSGGLPASVWSRYTSILGPLTVVGRDGGSLGDSDGGFTLSSAVNVAFQLLPNISNFRSLILGNEEVSLLAEKLVREHDGVIARLPSRLGSYFVKEAIRQGKPYAVEVVGCPRDSLWNYGSFKGKLFAYYAAAELRRLLRNTSFALYVTREFLQSRYPASDSAITAFCSNVEIPSVNDQVLQLRLRRISNKDGSEMITFGMIANYSSEYKGIDVAIKALAQSGLSNWRLIVVGKGDPGSYIRLAEVLGVGSKVQFIGVLPSGGPIFDWLDTIDIYLHPSLTEGMPRALVEAMSRGCPALGSEIGGIPELLEANEMVRPGDYKELGKKIVDLVNEKHLMLLLAERNFTQAKQYYKSTLDQKRAEFWLKFKTYVESRK